MRNVEAIKDELSEVSRLFALAAIVAPSSVTCHVQEMHIAAGHQLCGLVEAAEGEPENV